MVIYDIDSPLLLLLFWSHVTCGLCVCPPNGLTHPHGEHVDAGVDARGQFGQQFVEVQAVERGLGDVCLLVLWDDGKTGWD